MWKWLVLGLILLLTVIALTRLTVKIRYGRVGENDILVIEASAWFGLIRIKREIPVIKWRTSDGTWRIVTQVKGTGDAQPRTKQIDLERIVRSHRSYQRFQRSFPDVRPVYRQMLRHVTCTALEWHTVLGTGDAAGTGTLTGLAWGVKSVVVGVVSQTIRLYVKPRLSVQPVWNGERLSTHIRCHLHFFLVHALIAGARLLLLRWMRMQRQWKSEPSKA